MADLRTVNVRLGDESYSIQVRSGLVDGAGQIVRAFAPAGRAAIITDSTVGPLHASRLKSSLEGAGYDVVVATAPAGEGHKNLLTIEALFGQLLSAKLERTTPIVALGGGVIGDMAGFVAATLLRGVPFFNVPTTLLAMVDASIGGKTGVNHAMGKNLIGAFHQPRAVIVDPELLKTLPLRELRGGLAECIKHDVIRDVDGFAALEARMDRLLAMDMEALADLAAHNAAIKAAVVEADPFEKGERAHLNFGHTFGHAIERISNYTVAHGEAVALGMTAASRLAASLGLIDDAAAARIIGLVERAGLPTRIDGLEPQALMEAMAYDKKVKAGKLRFVLPTRIGAATVRDDVDAALVRKALAAILA